MIPKIIHYVWLGHSKIPQKLQKCICTWKKQMPNYQLICWNENNLPLSEMPFVIHCLKNRKYAFAADYIRLWALYNYGGIYMDTDVKTKKSFDIFLNYSFFTSIEYDELWFNKAGKLQVDGEGNLLRKELIVSGLGLHSAVIGSIKHHPILSDCLNIYKDVQYQIFDETVAINGQMARILYNYGFKYTDKFQLLNGDIAIFKSDVFSNIDTYTTNSYSLHIAEGSWKHLSISQRISRIAYLILPETLYIRLWKVIRKLISSYI